MPACNTLKEWTEAFMRYLQLERDASPHTIVNYRRDIQQFGKLVLGDDAAATPERLDLAAAREFLLHLHERKLARNSILRKVSSLRTFCRFLVREEALKENPFKGLSAPRRERALPHVFSVRQVAALLEAVAKLDNPKKRCANAEPLVFGREAWNGGGDGRPCFYHGLMGGVKIWARPLSAAEVRAEYERGRPAK